jgi:hypothetical protein
MEAEAVVDIGLSRSEFWEMTPRQFQAMRNRYTDREIRHERRTGLLAALYANAHRDPDKRAEPFTIEDFAPALRKSASEPAEPAFEGPAFLKPCPECGIAKWQGHMEWCKTGQKHFGQALDRAKASVQQGKELTERQGKPIVERRK